MLTALSLLAPGGEELASRRRSRLRLLAAFDALEREGCSVLERCRLCGPASATAESNTKSAARRRAGREGPEGGAMPPVGLP